MAGIALALGCVEPAAVRGQSNEGGIASDVRNEKEVRQLYTDFTAAWNRHDVPALTEMWAIDGDHLEPDGAQAKGRADVGLLFKRRHDTVFAKTRLDLSIADVYFLGEGAALVDGGYEITGILTPEGDALPARRGHLTAVLLKEHGKWWIVASRLMVPATLPYKK